MTATCAECGATYTTDSDDIRRHQLIAQHRPTPYVERITGSFEDVVRRVERGRRKR